MSDLLRRQAALEKTVAKYDGKAVDWCKNDCIHMARFHLRAMGHNPPLIPRYRSFIGAQRALIKAGGLCAVFDGILPRIPHARLLPGDVVVLEGDGGDSAMVSVGYKLMGWHQDAPTFARNIIPLEIKGAWRA